MLAEVLLDIVPSDCVEDTEEARDEREGEMLNERLSDDEDDFGEVSPEGRDSECSICDAIVSV